MCHSFREGFNKKNGHISTFCGSVFYPTNILNVEGYQNCMIFSKVKTIGRLSCIREGLSNFLLSFDTITFPNFLEQWKYYACFVSNMQLLMVFTVCQWQWHNEVSALQKSPVLLYHLVLRIKSNTTEFIVVCR